jgi:hypothetical protein
MMFLSFFVSYGWGCGLILCLALPSFPTRQMRGGGGCHAFVPPLISTARRRRTALALNDEDASPDDDDDIVTKEMFLRDLLKGPATDNGDEVVVKTKKGKGAGSRNKNQGYKVLDNRDILPFAVQLQTPDPYTHPEIKKKNAVIKKKRKDAVEEQIASTLYRTDRSSSNNNNNDDNTLLGEFSLDKHTTTGDLLLIGDSEYKVVRHRCQYKYAGGQRFVMVRKILEVKEVGRLLSEQYLQRQWKECTAEDTK